MDPELQAKVDAYAEELYGEIADWAADQVSMVGSNMDEAMDQALDVERAVFRALRRQMGI